MRRAERALAGGARRRRAGAGGFAAGRGRRLAGLVAGVALLTSGLVSCAADPLFDVVISNPGLYPVFQSSVTDYVNRCDPDRPTEVTVRAPEGAYVSIAGQGPRGGTFTARVDQDPNERFKVVVTLGETTTTHHVRCLPTDFPTWSAERTGTPQAEYYATSIITGFQPNRPVIFDTNGVPVWWSEPTPTFLTTPLPNGNLATLNYAGGMVERSLDGAIVRELDTVGAPSDFHDVLLLPNGNYVLATYDIRPCDLTAWGQPPASCLFHELQELTPEGGVAWSWRPEDDIPISETPERWRREPDPIAGAVDPWHYNSVEWTGDGFIVSFRHLDAVVKVDYATRDIVWKLGGTRRAESLRVVGDPVFTGGGSIAGQHDARLLEDGSLTLFDNGTRVDRPPRSVRYRIDEAARTATLAAAVRDPIAPSSPCCGSTRLLPGGNYVTGWGGTPWFTENAPDGARVFRMHVSFVYRAIPIEPGFYSRDELRAGMDAQYDGAAPAADTTATSASATDVPPERELQRRLGHQP